MLRPGVLAAVLATAIEVVLVVVGAPAWAKIPFGILLVLVLPGYVWLAAFRPDGSATAPLSGPLIAVMGSVGITIVSGLLLNVLPTGLTARNQVYALATVVAAGAVTGWARDLHRGVPRRSRQLHAPRRSTAIKLILAAGCVAVAAVLSLTSQHTANSSEHFTVLSLSGIRTDSPIVTVRSHQPNDVSYLLLVETDGRPRRGDQLLLSPGQTVSENLKPYVQGLAPDSVVRVTLTRPGSSKPSREVWFATSG